MKVDESFIAYFFCERVRICNQSIYVNKSRIKVSEEFLLCLGGVGGCCYSWEFETLAAFFESVSCRPRPANARITVAASRTVGVIDAIVC